MTPREFEEQQIGKADPWPLYNNWWLGIYSEPHEYEGFDNIVVRAEGGGHKRVITKIMVPKIDGIVCESHNFPAHLIRRNVEALEKQLEQLQWRRRELLESANKWAARAAQAEKDLEGAKAENERLRAALLDIAGATNDLCKMNSENEAAYSFIRDRAEEALAALKEKGLVE